MIEVFKTDVQCPIIAQRLINLLLEHFPGCAVNFDLQDCDRILRLKHNGIDKSEVSALLNRHGYICEELQD